MQKFFLVCLQRWFTGKRGAVSLRLQPQPNVKPSSPSC